MWSILCLIVLIGPIKGQGLPSVTSVDEEQEEISDLDAVGHMAQPYLNHIPCPWNSLMGPINIEETPSTTMLRRFIPVLVLEPEKRKESTVASFLNWEYAITLSRSCNFTSASLFDEQILIKNLTVIETQSFPVLGDFCLLKIENLRDLEDVLPKSFFPCLQDPMTQTFKDSLDLLRPSPTQPPPVSPGGEGSTDDNQNDDYTGYVDTFGVDTFGVDTFGVDTFAIDNFGTFGVDTLGIDNFGVGTFGVDSFGTFGVDNFGTFGVDTFGVDTFGVDNFGVNTFGIDNFGVDNFGVPTDGSSPTPTTTTTTTTTSSMPSASGFGFGLPNRKRRSAPGEPLVSTVLRDCYVQSYNLNLKPTLKPVSKLTVYIGENTQGDFRRHLGQFLPTAGDHVPLGLILKGSPVYCMYGGLPVLYGLHKGMDSFSPQKVIHNLDNQMAWVRRAILGVNTPEFVSISSDANLTSNMSAAAFNMNFRQFEILDCKEAILNITTSAQMTIHSPYGTESLDPGLANDDIIVKGNFTAIMITEDQTGHAEIKLNCLDGTKLLRHRLPNLSCAEVPVSTTSRDRRALNSMTVESSSWRWVASVRSQGSHRCGAILLSDTRVLTAASCVSETKQDLLTVAIGDHDRSQAPSVMVKNIRIHPNFRTIEHVDNNNLAILDIEKSEIAGSLKTPCLLEDHSNIANLLEKEKPECFIAGWGASNRADNNFYLRAGSFKVKTNSCRTKNNPTPEDLLQDQQEGKEYFVDPSIEICQKNEGDEVSPSPADVGGPVYCVLDGKTPFLAGIVGKVRVDGDPMKFTIQYFQDDFAFGMTKWKHLSAEEVSTPFGGDYKTSFTLRPGEVKVLSERFGKESVDRETWSFCKSKRMSVTGWMREGDITLSRKNNQSQININETTIYESVSENIARVIIDDFEIMSADMSPQSINLRFENGNQGQAEITVSLFCAHVMVTESMTSQTSSELLAGFYKMSNPRSNVVRRWEFGSVCPDGYDVFVDRFPEGPGGELNVPKRRFQAPAGFDLMFTPSQWYQDSDFTISWKCLNMAERQYQTTFIMKFHQFVPCGKRLTDALMENAELQILSAHILALEKESKKSITGSVVYADHFDSSFEIQDCKGPFKLASRNLLLKIDHHFSFHQEIREKIASFFERKNKVDSSFEILSTHDHVLGDGSPFVQLNGPAKEIDPILGHVRRFSFTEEIFMHDGGKCKSHEDEEDSFLFRPRTTEENRALAEYGSTPIAWDWDEKSTFDNYTKSFEILHADGSWNVKEDKIIYRGLPTCVYKSDLCPNFFYDKKAQALKKEIIIREISAGKRPGRYSVKRRFMKSLLFDLTKNFPITSNTETKARSGFLEGTVLRIQCKKWQEKKPISIRCTRIGDDPHLRFIICKNNVCNEDFNGKQLHFFQIDNLNGCS